VAQASACVAPISPRHRLPLNPSEITTNKRTAVKLVAFEDADRAAEGREFDFRKTVAYGAEKAFSVL
jgi:hypothetical protein